MTTNWTLHVKKTELPYLFMRGDGFPSVALQICRRTYRKMQKELEHSIWHPIHDLYALLLIRNEKRVEGFTKQSSNRHCIVNLDIKEIKLSGDWYPAFGDCPNLSGTYPLDKEDHLTMKENPSKRYDAHAYES